MTNPCPLKTSILFIAGLIFLIPSCAPRTDKTQDLPQTKYVEDFALLDHMGKFHELYDYSDMKAIVLFSQENGCPIVQKSYRYLEELKKKYEPLGVLFLMLNANPQDDRASIQQEAGAYGVDIPILEDRSQVISESLGIKRTSHAILINPHDWSVVYEGVLNDQFGYESQRRSPTNNYLENAINALLKNQPVLPSSTSIKGCLFNFEPQNRLPVTYARDIAPILINKCIVCHSPGQIAPWSMDNYKKIKSHGAMIREVLRTRRMPPWGADPSYKKLKYDRSLTPEETRLLIHWIEQGMNKGDGADPLLTAVRPAINGWPLGKPDLIVSFKYQQSIPATGILNYRYILSDKVIDRDRWIKAIYWKPGNRKVLHHALLLVRYDPSGEHQDWYSNSGMPFALHKNLQMIDNYSPGIAPLILSDDTGMYLPKGSQLAFSIHYTTTGKPELDDTQAGIYFHQNKPPKILSIYWYDNLSIQIPPHAKDYAKTGFLPIKYGMTVYAIKPHMHLRGKSMKIIAHYPNGSSEIILSVPHFSYNWQLKYYFQTPIHLPMGSTLEIQAHYDNSSENPGNPDPDKTVIRGNLTWDEMMKASIYYVRDEP